MRSFTPNKLQIGKEYDTNFWEKAISKEILIEEDKKWDIFDNNEEIIAFISDDLESNEIKMEVKGLTLIINLTFKIPKGGKEYSFILILEEKRTELDLSSTFTSINKNANLIRDSFVS